MPIGSGLFQTPSLRPCETSTKMKPMFTVVLNESVELAASTRRNVKGTGSAIVRRESWRVEVSFTVGCCKPPGFAEMTAAVLDGIAGFAQRFDAGIRMLRSIQQDMVTTRLTGSFKIILVASRDYLDARGTPKSIPDLHQHNCIGARSVATGAVRDWELLDGKKPTNVKTSAC